MGTAATTKSTWPGCLAPPYPKGADGRAITDPAKDARLEKLHWQTAAALQVLLANAKT